jgi:pSer/pThr/pTyr-binding forkhead associated (FHA) protein
MVIAEGKRMPVGPGGAVIGRSRECDIVLQDSNVSRRHAEIRPSGGDGWTITDLGSTNGVKVNGRAISAATPLSSGDEIAVGTVDVRFEVDR